MTAAESSTAQGYVPPTPERVQAARDLVARFAARWDRPIADGLRDLMHPDTRNLIPPMAAAADRDGVVEHFRQVLKRLPDLRLDVLRWALTGDTVMIEWRATASVAGEPLCWTGVDVMRLRGDRMYEAQVYWDTRGFAEQAQAKVQAAERRTAKPALHLIEPLRAPPKSA